MNKNIINQFLLNNFPLRKVRGGKNKWVPTIIIPKGFISNDKITYNLKEPLNKTQIKIDVVKIVSNVFGCEEETSRLSVNNYFKTNFKF